VRFCDQLVQRFWSSSQFDVAWYPLSLLQEQTTACEVAQRGAGADMIIFAVDPEGEVAAELLAWVENWLGRRGEREGILVGLLDPATAPIGHTTPKYMYLRHAAHRGGMDYLTQLPSELPRSIPDSLEYCSERAGRITAVLDEILHRPAPIPQQPL